MGRGTNYHKGQKNVQKTGFVIATIFAQQNIEQYKVALRVTEQALLFVFHEFLPYSWATYELAENFKKDSPTPNRISLTLTVTLYRNAQSEC